MRFACGTKIRHGSKKARNRTSEVQVHFRSIIGPRLGVTLHVTPNLGPVASVAYVGLYGATLCASLVGRRYVTEAKRHEIVHQKFKFISGVLLGANY